MLINFGNLPAQDLSIDQVAFKEGEKIVYKIYYNWKFVWIPAGEVSFSVKENPDSFEFEVYGRSYPSYDSFFKVRDDYVSRVDKSSLLPQTFRRDILEGNYERYDSISFLNRGKIVEFFGKTREEARRFDFAVEEKVLDMVGCIYYLRSLKLGQFNPGDKIPFRIFFDKELFELNVRVNGKEKKKVKGLGSLSTWHIQPELVTGYVFKEGDIMDIWISDDKNKIPLLIESPISFGMVKAVLKSVDGLKYNYDYNLQE